MTSGERRASARAFSAALLEEGEVIVDALLGTGLNGAVRPRTAPGDRADQRGGPAGLCARCALGLDGDTGVPLGEAVRADCTVTFVGLKTGLFIG